MQIGEQLHAPGGFEVLAQDVVYHFLISDALRYRVVLVTFGAPVDTGTIIDPNRVLRKTAPSLVYLRRDRFEEAIYGEQILRCQVQRELPHWMGDATITRLRLHDQQENSRQRPHEDRIDLMLGHIWPALQRLQDILTSHDPNLELNRLARSCTPGQNETRFRAAFFGYLAFRMEPLALHYSIARIGRWDRAKKDKKLGRPSSLGPWHGFSSCPDDVQQMCEAGFRRFSRPGVSLRQIYRDTMIHVFGCAVETDPNLRKRFVQPEGKPYVTEGQFAYRVAQRFDLPTRQLLKYGEDRVKSKLRPSQGQFTDAVANLMEMLEEDAYSVDEVAQGYMDGSYLPRLLVVRIRCLASGMLVGIGFSIKGERAEAYRSAKACMAVDKVWYCALFGVVISDEEWPSIGLPLHEIVDRGPGATAGADTTAESLKSMIKEMTPSHSGQSKANIEATNPKPVKLEGAPHHRVTRSSIPQLAAREIRRLIDDNLTTNIQARLTPGAIAAGVMPTPIAYWNYLSKLGRTFAYTPTREQAVRGFFTPVDLTISDGAVFFMGFRFWSLALRECSLIHRTHGSTMKVRGYMLEACVRHIILDTPEGLLMVDAMIGIRDGDEERFLSVAELEQLAQLRSREQAALKIHRQAAKAETSQRFEDETGTPYERFEIRSGRAKRGTAASLEEARQITPFLRIKGGQK